MNDNFCLHSSFDEPGVEPTSAPATEAPTQAPTAAPISGNYVFKLTDTMKAGGEYIIATKDAAGSAYALKNDGGTSDGTSLARESVTISAMVLQ